MTNLDLREAFNVVSEVVVNRPEALREFDQIYMKISDMLLHAELVSRWVDGKSMVFLEVWPESHWPGFALHLADVLQPY